MMSIISMFFGIVVRMYVDDYNPPHVHAEYQEHKAVYSLDGELLSGELPKKQHRLFVGWGALHEDELRASWDVVHEGEQPYPINPLR